MKRENGFEKKILNDMNARKKPVLLTETERVETWKDRLSCGHTKASMRNVCEVMDFETVNLSEGNIGEYDVIYIDDSDLFFRFLTGGCSAFIKRDAEVVFEQNEIVH